MKACFEPGAPAHSVGRGDGYERKKEEIETRRVAAWKAATACIDLLKTRFGVRRAFIVGSLAGHSPWHARSDIDIALAPERYFEALRACWGTRLKTPGCVRIPLGIICLRWGGKNEISGTER